MFDILQKALYVGVGAALMTKEKIEAMGRRIAQEAKLSEAEGKKLVDDLVKRSEDARASIEKMVKSGIDAALKGLDLPTREEFKKMEKRIRQLEGK
jgi:polyhydroxyalkanoate synthesis regulator phasin